MEWPVFGRSQRSGANAAHANRDKISDGVAALALLIFQLLDHAADHAQAKHCFIARQGNLLLIKVIQSRDEKVLKGCRYC